MSSPLCPLREDSGGLRATQIFGLVSGQEPHTSFFCGDLLFFFPLWGGVGVCGWLFGFWGGGGGNTPPLLCLVATSLFFLPFMVVVCGRWPHRFLGIGCCLVVCWDRLISFLLYLRERVFISCHLTRNEPKKQTKEDDLRSPLWTLHPRQHPNAPTRVSGA